MELCKHRMGRPQLPQILVAFSLTVFCLYTVQDLALHKIQESLSGQQLAVQDSPAAVQSLQHIEDAVQHKERAVHHPRSQQQQQQQQSDVKEDNILENKVKRKRGIWITMAVCWGENAQVHGKQNFPYLEAAKRSTSIWQSLTEATVILQIVYNGTLTENLRNYKENLERTGAMVLLRTNDDLSCVLTAQLIRLLAYELDAVDDDDVIITADVDAFVMTKDILLPLNKVGKKVWIWRYELTAVNGYTFMMPFIGAIKHVWRDMLEYKGSLKGMVDHYGNKMNFKDDYTWDVDQHIVSRAILEKRLCSLPRSNALWKEVNLDPKPFKDVECWHGSGIYEDCNNKLWTRNAFIRYEGKGCKWWHFYPDEGVKELQDKYSEIMRNKGDTGLLSSLIQGAASLKSNYLDKFISQEEPMRADPNGELEIWSDHNP